MIDPGILVWLACLFLTIVALRFIPSWWKRKRSHHAQTDEQRIMANAMLDWLQQRKIVQAVLESGAYSHRDLQFTFEAIPWMSEYQLRTAAQMILLDRTTRRVIAGYMEKAHGTDKSEVMEALLSWAQVAA